jgi:hypothetical protein
MANEPVALSTPTVPQGCAPSGAVPDDRRPPPVPFVQNEECGLYAALEETVRGRGVGRPGPAPSDHHNPLTNVAA